MRSLLTLASAAQASLRQQSQPLFISWGLGFCVLAPFALILLGLGVFALHDPVTAAYLSIGMIASGTLVVRFRTYGLVGSFALLSAMALLCYPAVGERLWYWSTMLSLALDSYLILLATEEVEDSLRLEREHHAKERQFFEREKQHQESLFEHERLRLEAELKKWKEEAEQRKIDKANDERKLALQNVELSRLATLREELLADARSARLQSEQRLLRLEEEIAENSRLVALVQTPATPAAEGQELPQAPALHDETLRKERAQALGLYRQLRTQFEEKSRILEQTRKELFGLQTKLMVQEREACSEDPDYERLFCEFASLVCKYDLLEEEITSLEELISRILAL